MLLQSLLTKLGAAGLAAKAAAGGTAVVVAASAAGAADALPEPAQDAFERITAEEVVEVEDEGEKGPEEGSFGARVSQDAIGEAGDEDEPGVDGCEIAREASGRDLEDCGTDTDDTDDADDGEGEGPEEGSFGARVSQDATGEAGDEDEPGVDGRQIAEEAKANGNGDGDTDDDGDGGLEGTRGEDAVNTFRPDDEG